MTDVAFVVVAVAQVRTCADQYDTNSENHSSDREDEHIYPITASRSGRPIRVHFCLGPKGPKTRIIHHFTRTVIP